MLQKMNERLKGIVSWVIVIFISFTFVLFGVEYYVQSRQSATNLAEVNGQPISPQQFETVFRRLQQEEISQGQKGNEKALKNKVLESLILNTILFQAAEHSGLFIGLNQANAMILQIPQFQISGKFSSTQYQQALVNAMYTPASFLHEVMLGMLLNQQRFGFVGSAFALPQELKRYAELLYEKRDYAYMDVPLSLFNDRVEVSETEANDYYKKHIKEFMTKPQVQIAYLLLSIDSMKSNTMISEDDLQRYYEENKTNFTQPTRWKVAHILFAFPSKSSKDSEKQTKEKAEQAYNFLNSHPENFSEWAKTKSDDLIAAKHSGELPWIVAGQLSTLEPIVLSLSKPGEIARPYRTENGYELVKLLAIEQSTIKPFTVVREQIRKQLLTEKSQALYSRKLETLGELTYQSPESLEPAAKELNLTILHSQPFSKTSSNEALTKLPQVINAAFSKDVLELGNNSELIQLDDNRVMVLRVEKQFPSKLQTYAMKKESILKQLKLEKIKKLVEKLPGELMKGQIDPLISSLPWHEVKAVSREDKTTEPDTHTLAFKIDAVNNVRGIFLPNGNYLIVRLNKIEPGQIEALDVEQKRALVQQLESSIGRLDYDLYVQGLVELAKIKRG